MSIEKSRSSSRASRATSGFARLTAVVLNWDEPELTTRCVEALVGDGVPPGRIVVVDNGSQGDSFEQFERKLSECVLVRLPTNVGIARAVNIGAARLEGDDYLILNNDAFVHGPASVARLVDALRRDRVGIAVPRTLNEDLTLQPSVVALAGPATAFVGALGLSRLVPNRWQPRWSTHWDHGESRAIDAASGAVYAVRGDVWRELGGMSERRLMYGEDIDLCRRARARGWSIWFERDATFVHLDAMNHLAGLEIADLEAEQTVDGDEYKRLIGVDGERSNARAERADGLHDLVRFRVGDGQQRRFQAGQVHARPVEADDGVVGGIPGLDAREQLTLFSVDDVPVVFLQARDVQNLPIGSNR